LRIRALWRTAAILLLASPEVVFGTAFGCRRENPARSFPVSHFTINAPLGPSEEIHRTIDLQSDFAWLFPVKDDLLAGPGVFVGAWRNGGWHSRWGLEATGNLYLSGSSHLSVSPGIIVSDSPFPDGFAGFTLGVGLGINDWAGLSSRLDLTRSPQSSYEPEFHLGLRLGSIPGLAATTIAGAAGAIAWLESEMD